MQRARCQIVNGEFNLIYVMVFISIINCIKKYWLLQNYYYEGNGRYFVSEEILAEQSNQESHYGAVY